MIPKYSSNVNKQKLRPLQNTSIGKVSGLYNGQHDRIIKPNMKQYFLFNNLIQSKKLMKLKYTIYIKLFANDTRSYTVLLYEFLYRFWASWNNPAIILCCVYITVAMNKPLICRSRMIYKPLNTKADAIYIMEFCFVWFQSSSEEIESADVFSLLVTGEL